MSYSCAALYCIVPQGLMYLHEHNQLHRDVKPSNILLNAKGEVRQATRDLRRRVRSILSLVPCCYFGCHCCGLRTDSAGRAFPPPRTFFPTKLTPPDDAREPSVGGTHRLSLSLPSPNLSPQHLLQSCSPQQSVSANTSLSPRQRSLSLSLDR